MNKEIKKIKDTTIECPICRNKIKIALPTFIDEYHEDMYITHEMEYRERKRLEKKITNLEQENEDLKNRLGNLGLKCNVYKSRINKAVDYINSTRRFELDSNKPFRKISKYEEQYVLREKDLLNILTGSDEE